MSKKRRIKLGVNVDHVATLRQARKIVDYPNPSIAAALAQEAGADSIVAHLRKDRRHIKEDDLLAFKRILRIPLNLEMSTEKEIVDIACQILPQKATLVPERRQEITTEGGLDVAGQEKKIARVIEKLKQKSIEVSLFIDPKKNQIRAAQKLGAEAIEIHTGRFANAKTPQQKDKERQRIIEMSEFAKACGLFVAAGHGLNYQNVNEIAAIEFIEELNIGHSIISQAVFLGIKEAVKLMIKLISC